VISPVLFTPDEKTYAYSAFRQACYLFTVSGVR